MPFTIDNDLLNDLFVAAAEDNHEAEVVLDHFPGSYATLQLAGLINEAQDNGAIATPKIAGAPVRISLYADNEGDECGFIMTVGPQGQVPWLPDGVKFSTERWGVSAVFAYDAVHG
jgi:hypothetical protein